MNTYNVGDIVTVKKSHPCGSADWQILRTGTDFKLKCCGCGRVVMFDYESFKKRVKKVKERADGTDK